MSISSVNNSNYVPQYVTDQDGTNPKMSKREQITEMRKMMREVTNRADPGGRLMQSHVNLINMMAANGTNNPFRLNAFTPAMESLQNQRLNVIQQFLSEEEEGTLRFTVLQEMLTGTQEMIARGRSTGTIGGGNINKMTDQSRNWLTDIITAFNERNGTVASGSSGNGSGFNVTI